MPAVKRGYLQDSFVKQVIAGAILLAFIWVGNIYFFQQYQLAEPLFLQQNFELNVADTDMLDLYYLVRAKDDAQVIFLSFPALGSAHEIYPSIQFDQQHNNFFRIKRVQVELTEELIKSLDDPEVLLEEANVTFNNGTVGTFNIGQIRLYTEAVPNHFTWQSSGGGSDNTGRHFLTANETVEVVGLAFDGDIELLNLTINGHSFSPELFPFTVVEERGLTVNYALEFPDDIQEFNYSQGLTLLTETESGEAGQTHIKINYFNLQMNEIKKLLRNRGEL